MLATSKLEIIASSSDANKNPESTNPNFVLNTEFVYLFLCSVNVTNNIHFNELKSRFVLTSDEVIVVYFEKATINL